MNIRAPTDSTSCSAGVPRRISVVFATLSLIAAACSGAAMTAAPAEPSPMASVTPSPPRETPGSSSTAAPTSESVWRSSSIPPMLVPGISFPVAVTAAESELVTVGGRAFRDNETPSGGIAGVWRSVDGLTWEPATASANLAVGDVIPIEGTSGGMVDVAYGPAGFVAVGITLESFELTAMMGGAWYSKDGRDWIRSHLPMESQARPTSVTWNGSHYVAVGVVEAKDAPRATVWLSPDGRSWRVADGTVFDVGNYIETMHSHVWGGPTDVTSATDGVVYAIGQMCRGTAGDPTLSDQVRGDTNVTCLQQLWRSADGEAWTTIQFEEAVTASWSASVAASGGRVVAVGGPRPEGSGELPDAPAHVLIGTEAGWRVIELAGVPRLERVVAFGQGFVAAAIADARISLWESPDGVNWSVLSGVPQPAGVTHLNNVDLAVFGDSVVLVGTAWFSSEIVVGGFAIVWSRR